MNTTTTTAATVEWPRLPAEDVQPITLARVIASEWVKFRSLRSSRWMIGAGVAGMIVIGLIVAFNTRQLAPNIQADDTNASATLQGYYLAMYLMGALGVLCVAGEYGTGMIRSTLTAVPHRLPVVWAKALVLGVVGLITMTAASFAAFVVAQGLISHYRTGYSLGDPGVLRSVIGTGIFLTLIALFGSALGWIFRSTPGALVTFFGLVVALPVLLTVFGSAGLSIAQYSPIFAGSSFIQTKFESPSLSPWAGLLVLVAWVVVAMAVGIWRLLRQDA